MDLNETVDRAYEIGLELLKEHKVSFSVDELFEKFSSRYGSPIPFKRHGFDSLEALLESSDFFVRCPQSNEFRCVKKENYELLYDLPPPRGFSAVNSVSKNKELHKIKEENSEEHEKKQIEDPSKLQKEISRCVKEEEDSDEEIRSMQIAMRGCRKRMRASDPGPPRFSLDGQQAPLLSKPQRSRSISPSSKRMRPAVELQKPTENPVSTASVTSATTSDSLAQSMIDKIACCIDFFNNGYAEVKLKHLLPVFQHLFKTNISAIMMSTFGSGDAFEELAKIEQNKFTMRRRSGKGIWVLQKIVEKKKIKRNRKHLSSSERRARKRQVLEKQANEIHSGEAKTDYQSEERSIEAPADNPLVSDVIDRIFCCLLQCQGAAVKLDDLKPLFKEMYQKRLNNALKKAFRQGNALEELAKISQTKFTLTKSSKLNWIFQAISEKKKNKHRRKKKEKQAIENDSPTEITSSSVPVSSSTEPAINPELQKIIDRITRCLRLFDENEVTLEQFNRAFGYLYTEKFSEMLTNLFGHGNVFEELARIDQNKFVLKQNTRGNWIFQKNVDFRTENGQKEKEKQLGKIMDRICRCLRLFDEDEVTLDQFNRAFGYLYTEKLSEMLTNLFGHNKVLEELAKINQNKFALEKNIAKGTWIFHKKVDKEKAQNVVKLENKVTEHIPLPPPIDMPHNAPRSPHAPRDVPHAMASPFLPRVQFFPRPMYPRPPPPYPLFMNDPRLPDFAYRIRHVLANMGGRGPLHKVEEAYFRTFESHLQDDFFCLVPDGTPPYILTEISHGEILVNKTQDGWIHFQLKNFY